MNLTINLKTLQGQVEYILATIPETRNSDIALMVALWERFYPLLLVPTGKGSMVFLSKLYDLPREDNIKRVRAKFQNELKQYLPTSLEVAKQRKINEEVWREAMGHSATTFERI